MECQALNVLLFLGRPKDLHGLKGLLQISFLFLPIRCSDNVRHAGMKVTGENSIFIELLALT